MPAECMRKWFIGLAGCLVLWAISYSSATSGVGCLTNEEARRIWPREHLYWHTGARCWDASSPAEYKAKGQRKVGADTSALGLAEATQYSLFVSRFAELSPPFLWIDAIAWWPTAAQSFESRWNDSLGELRRSSGSNTDVLALAASSPEKRASLAIYAQ
jgi:hypothetical protein